jgi:ATP phosphoribosyltransferase
MSDDSQNLMFGFPKGSLQNATADLFQKAGFNLYISSRGYKPKCDDPEISMRLLRAQEIGRYVHQGFLDCGITGKDWIAENRADVEVICDLQYSKVTSNPTRWVLAVPEDSDIHKIEDLEGKRIATEAVGLTEQLLTARGVKAEIEFSWGATEVKVPELVDAIVDITETGSSLRANNLRIVDTLMESYPQLIANKAAFKDPWKQEKLDQISLLLRAALNARDKVGLKMKLPEKELQNLLDCLPSLRRPTVANLAEEGWVAVETVIDEAVVREIIPKLKSLGAEGIIEYPLNKLVP